MRFSVFATAVGLLLSLSCVSFADDCEFIREQIRQMPSSGGEIFIPRGFYDCASSIVLNKSHLRLRGAGQDQTFIRLKNQVHAPLLVIGDDKTLIDSSGNYVTTYRVEDIQVSDFTLDGNWQNHDVSKECGETVCGNNPFAIRNNGISIRGASYITVERITTRSMISGGLVTEKYCNNLKVRDFNSYDNYFDGLAGYETENSEFTNLYLHHNLGAGISMDLNFNKNTFRNSRIEQNHDVGLFMRQSNQNRFEKLQVLRNGNHGVFIAQSGDPGTCASDNDFENVSVNYSKRSGIRVNDDCRGNRILGNSNLCLNAETPVSESHPGNLQIDTTVSCRP